MITCVEMLIQGRADINIQGKCGSTALIVAAFKGHDKV